MKSVILILSALFFCSTIITAQNTISVKDSIKASKKLPFMLFENTTHDYGTIEYNGDGTCEFKFKNTGKSPLVISNCQASCGCTVPEWPKEPIQKGATGVIKVKYNTTRVGLIQKTITVTSNSMNSPVILNIKGTVNKAKEEKTVPTKDETVPSINKTN